MSHGEGDLPRMTSASWPFFSLCLRSGTLLEIFRLPSPSLMIERIPQDPKCIGACTQSLDHQAPAILWTAINERQSQRTQGSGLQKASPQAQSTPMDTPSSNPSFLCTWETLCNFQTPLRCAGPVMLSSMPTSSESSFFGPHLHHFHLKSLLWPLLHGHNWAMMGMCLDLNRVY